MSNRQENRIKIIEIISIIVINLIISSPVLSINMCFELGDRQVFGLISFLRYSWVMLLFIPLCIILAILGRYLKKNNPKDNRKYKINYIVAFVFIPLLLIFGSYRFFFKNIVTYDMRELELIESETDIRFPDQITIATINGKNYSISYAKINNIEEKNDFEAQLAGNNIWWTLYGNELNSEFPKIMQWESKNNFYDYYLVYNFINNTYNDYPINKNECVFIIYNAEYGKIMIYNGNKIS